MPKTTYIPLTITASLSGTICGKRQETDEKKFSLNSNDCTKLPL